MRLLITGDLHIRSNAPERRLDDYWVTVSKKIDFILDLAVKEKCDLILQPGDFFDSHKANDFLKRHMIKRLKKIGIKVITVFGQHDLRYHSSEIKNTPLAVLNAAEVVYLAYSEPLDFDGVHIYGTSWYEDIPETVINPNVFNILIVHKMVIENAKLWKGQEDHKLGNVLLKTLPYNLIVSADNHLSFLITNNNKRLVNCGSLLRSNIDQINHAPVVYVFDVLKGTPLVPCEPFDQVFDMAKVSAEKARDEKMETFVDRLTGEAELEGLDFIKNMHTFVGKNKEEIDDATQEVIEEVMGD
jgi:predicted phosphodiesterase